MEKILKKNLLLIVAAYRKATGKSMSQVSKQFYGKSDFFEKFGSGQHTLGLDRFDAMVNQFRKEWPDDAHWPITQPVLMLRHPQP